MLLLTSPERRLREAFMRACIIGLNIAERSRVAHRGQEDYVAIGDGERALVQLWQHEQPHPRHDVKLWRAK